MKNGCSSVTISRTTGEEDGDKVQMIVQIRMSLVEAEFKYIVIAFLNAPKQFAPSKYPS